ncbi:MAG: DNA-3-methyladenine glycosylase I [Proteobacteria bacterium]|nr:DNA-3-methyladenine glycosylase I [Pseudomonadota bacterium]
MDRCGWAEGSPIYQDYHDQEWGVPVYESQRLFAKLILDGFQAGLSWITILKKRENFYQAFDRFNPEIIALYDQVKIDELMSNKGIIRNKLKIRSTISNAILYLEYENQGHSFSELLWSFVGGTPIINRWTSLDQIPASTTESDEMSKALKKLGFKFTGTTICYAFMQAVGMINDHLVSCNRHDEVVSLKKME